MQNVKQYRSSFNEGTSKISLEFYPLRIYRYQHLESYLYLKKNVVMYYINYVYLGCHHVIEEN